MRGSAVTGKRIALSAVMSKVLLAGDNLASLAMLRDLFEAHHEFSLCGQAQTGEEAISKAAQLEPSLIILDFGDSFTKGLRAAKGLREILPSVQIFLLTGDHSFYVEKAAVLCGIDAVFAREEGLEPLLSNARAACGFESAGERK